MNNHTKSFIQKLANLMEEYNCNMEIEGDSYSGGPMQITLEVLNPQTFDEHYDQYLAEHPGEEGSEGTYPWNSDLYKFADYVDLGFNIDADKLRGKVK